MVVAVRLRTGEGATKNDLSRDEGCCCAATHRWKRQKGWASSDENERSRFMGRKKEEGEE